MAVCMERIRKYDKGLASWKRSIWMGLGVVVLMATGKIVWSIQNAGESDRSIVAPALIGLFICAGLINFGFKRLERKVQKHGTQ